MAQRQTTSGAADRRVAVGGVPAGARAASGRARTPVAEPRWRSDDSADARFARWRTRLRLWLANHPEEIRSWLTSVGLHAIVLLVVGVTVVLPGAYAPSLETIVADLDPPEFGSESGFADGLNLAGTGAENPQGDPTVRETTAADMLTDSAQEGGRGIGFPRLSQGAAVVDPAEDDDDEAEEAPPVTAKSGNRPASRAGRGGAGSGKGTGREMGADVAGLLDGRGDEARARLVKKAGGTRETERAVELGLAWLARHQRSDGSWSFQHGPDDPGILDCPTGATGLALLAFLGAGNTHQKGPYMSHVKRGLAYLLASLEETENGGWLGGTGLATMYVQGIGTIALCESYSMTKDPSLMRPAQLAVDFIVNAQDPEGGGWRYRIPQAGDTSVLGWQIMALTSARIAELKVHPRVLPKASGFLQRVQSSGGALYGYTHPNSVRNSTTAVGLLCRMYLGREQTNRGLIRGIKYLSDWGPNSQDMYYSYYGTQALHNWGGAAWERWNNDMRKQLVETQFQEGIAAGSWMTDNSVHADMGGRLYTTCLSILTLEVYYRYLPVYRKKTDLTDDPDGDLQ